MNKRELESMQAYQVDECCKGGNCPVCNPPEPLAEEIDEDEDAFMKRTMKEVSICDSAPYPKCNGAEGCDNCKHQKEDDDGDSPSNIPEQE